LVEPLELLPEDLPDPDEPDEPVLPPLLLPDEPDELDLLPLPVDPVVQVDPGWATQVPPEPVVQVEPAWATQVPLGVGAGAGAGAVYCIVTNTWAGGWLGEAPIVLPSR